MAERLKNFINGRWVESKSGRTFKSLNPAHIDEVVAVAPDSNAADVDEAVKAARTAFPAWSRIPAPRRGEMLFRVAELLVQHKVELGKLVTREMGKVLPEGLGDVQEAIDMAYYMAGEGRRLSGETVPSELPNKDAKSVRVPIGVFGCITPWNFPTAIPAWKLFPALIAGNTVVLKPAEESPACAARMVEIMEEAGLPPGTVNLVHGLGKTGEALVKHPDVDGISFTGSMAVGRRVEALAAAGHKTFSTETGGKNVIIVMADANLDLAIEGAIWGGFGTSGQRCTAASRIIVQEPVYDWFVARFTKAADGLQLGDGLKPATQMGPVVSEAQYKKVLSYIKIGQKEGATLLHGGRPCATGDCKRGWFIEPTIFTDVTPAMRIAREEIFGPVVCIFKIRRFDEALKLANDTVYGLSASIYTQDVNASAIAERELDSGLVYINASTIGAEIQLPFGGTKGTGSGPREAGGRGGALDLYTKWKVIYRDFSGRLQRAQIDKE
ncbi:MAG: aldehyde dehydrogenase family protein [Nitrospirota bacterium]